MPFVATINVPGYMPMDDAPPEFDTARDAWQYLLGERKESEDQGCDETCEPGCEWSERTDAYSDTWSTLDTLGNQRGDCTDEEWWLLHGMSSDGQGTVYGRTPGYHGDHDLGLAYSVTVAS